MRKAVIDLGTNTFNLLIADVYDDHFTVVHSSKEGVALGMGGINERVIAPDAFERAVTTIGHFMELCLKYGAAEVKAIGTSAVRDASNSGELIAAVQKCYGIVIEVVDGMREAELIYNGVNWSCDFSEPSLIMDIGGGSTEFIRGHAQHPLQFCSLDIGVSRAVQLFDLSDPISSQDRQQLIEWFESKSTVLNTFDHCTTFVGASGTFETFYEMVHEMPFPQSMQPIRLHCDELKEILEWIIASTFAERERHPYIIPIRRRMAPVSALMTQWILEKFGIREVLISPFSLKEGALKSF